METGSSSPRQKPRGADHPRRPTARKQPQGRRATVTEEAAVTAMQPICSLPVVGATTVEDAVFYAAIGVVTLAELVSWPTAALVATGHALHQRARNVARTGVESEAREGLIEAFGDVA